MTALRRVRAEERGFTLVEVLVVTAVLAVILTAVLNMLDTTARLAPRDQERGHVIHESQVGIHRMTRELRHAYKIDSAGPWTITASVFRDGTSTQVTYDCTAADPARDEYRVCNRSVGASGGAEEPVVEHVVLRAPAGGGDPPDIFTYRANGAGRTEYVSVEIVTAASGDLESGHGHTVTLRDGFFLRNVDSCGPQDPTACP
jgi:prepilin-type N-terminal cleavage/methylation domain-containing protein